MNAAIKAKTSNIITAVTAAAAILQTLIVNPPFSDRSVYVIGAILTYVVLVLTYVKQFLSPDVNAKAERFTIWTLVVASVAGLADLIGVFDLNEKTEAWIRWGISVVIALVNILSRTFFPSYEQNKRMEQLKQQ